MKIRNLLTGTALVALIAASPARADIMIGLIAPTTGPVAAYGDQVKNWF